ncbi:hypothetical protein A5637_18875 [Mycolicibacterium fortuitum]|nr:hypothetical protein A5637_18875 [Mycolicibacterium fortuitum]OBK66327.1 hypothetical protein A5654_18410 [Mycolicibacterium fortuitum]OCB48693.1 hypothetical protein A5721_04945 [Mycolicibacterium vulneris]
MGHGMFSNTVMVTVSHGGLGSSGSWSVTIDGKEIVGGDADLSAVQGALWNVPTSGGTVTVDGVGTVEVPHQAAGRLASITMADLAMVPGGDTVTLRVGDGDRLET